ISVVLADPPVTHAPTRHKTATRRILVGRTNRAYARCAPRRLRQRAPTQAGVLRPGGDRAVSSSPSSHCRPPTNQLQLEALSETGQRHLGPEELGKALHHAFLTVDQEGAL